MVSLDYSQAELRLGAFIARDDNLRNIINSGGDVHQNTAEMVDVDRDTAKRINFGSVYGLGARGLSRKMRIPYEEAEDFLEKWHHVFTDIRPAYNHWQTFAKKHHHIRLWTGRMRRYNVPWAEHRKAFSNAVQGGVAEIMRHAICRIDERATLYNRAHMLLQVHDQILAEVPDTKKGREQIARMAEYMEDFPQFNPRPKVDVKIGDRWSTLSEWERVA
jgi:DNA polymerase-1